MDFLLDNRPLRLLTSRTKSYETCSYDKLIAHLNEVDFFKKDTDVLFPTFLALEFVGIDIKKIKRPVLTGTAFPRLLSDRVPAIFDYALNFFSENPDISAVRLRDRFAKQSKYQYRKQLSQGIYRNLETRLHSARFQHEVCRALALDFVSAVNTEPFDYLEAGELKSGSSLSPDERIVHSNSELLSWILRTRENLAVPITSVRIASKICTHSMKSNVFIEVDGEKEPLKDFFSFRTNSDGADMEYIDFALLGCSGRPVISITFDDHDQAALRMGVVRWLYKNAIARFPGANDSADHARLIDGEVLHFSNQGIKRIQASNLGAVDLKIVGL